MRFALPLVLSLIVLVVLYLQHRRRQRNHRVHRPVLRTELARIVTHAQTTTPPAELLEEVVTTLLATRPKGRPPRRFVVAARTPGSVEMAERLVERPELGDVVRFLLEAVPGPDGRTRVRYEVLHILTVDRLLDRLREVGAVRDQVLGVVTRLDPQATFTDELLELDEPDEPAAG